MRATVSEQDSGTRLDAYLAKVYPERSRAAWQKMIEDSQVLLNHSPSKPSARLSLGDDVTVLESSVDISLDAADLPILCVVYSDPNVVVLDKQPGVVVHPGPGHSAGTMVDSLVVLFPEMHGLPAPGRPGIVHRLDKDTSGLMVAARTARALSELQRQMKERTIEKRYLALVDGNLPDDCGLIDLPIERDTLRRQRMAVQLEGKSSRTYFTVLERFGSYTYVEAKPVSGRTHQIRVHFAFIGHPVSGDRLYGSGRGPDGLARQALHATMLAFDSPSTGERLVFNSPLPGDLERCLLGLRTRRGEPAAGSRLLQER